MTGNDLRDELNRGALREVDDMLDRRAQAAAIHFVREELQSSYADAVVTVNALMRAKGLYPDRRL